MKLWGLGSGSLLHFRRMFGTTEAYFSEIGRNLPAQLGMHLLELWLNKAGEKRKTCSVYLLALNDVIDLLP